LLFLLICSATFASIAQEHGAEVIDRGAIGTRQCDLDQRIRQMPSKATHLIFVRLAPVATGSPGIE
jgi:hypothetical protein